MDKKDLFINLFKQKDIQYYIKVPNHMPKIDKIIDYHISTEILNIEMKCRYKHINKSGKKLIGKYIAIIGKIFSGIEYITSEKTLHYLEYNHLFSTYMKLEDSTEYIDKKSLKIDVIDNYVKKVDKDSVFQSILVLIHKSPKITLDMELNKQIISKVEENFESAVNSLKYCHDKKYFTKYLCTGIINLDEEKSDVKSIISALVDSIVINHRVINTIDGRSEDGQHLSGKMLMVEMLIRQKILYMADNKMNSINGVEREFFNIGYIVIPEFMSDDSIKLLIDKLIDIKVETDIITVKSINKRKIWSSISMYIEMINQLQCSNNYK